MRGSSRPDAGVSISRRRFLESVLFVTAAAALAWSACAQCTSATESLQSGASLSGFESNQEIARWEHLEGRDAGAGPYPFSVNMVTTRPLWSASTECPAGGTCIRVQSNQGQGPGFLSDEVVIFDIPATTGTIKLTDLHAVICDVPCSPVSGTLAVTELAPPCDGGTCPVRFTASLTIDSTSTDGGPSIQGKAQLHYAEDFHQMACPVLPAGG